MTKETTATKTNKPSKVFCSAIALLFFGYGGFGAYMVALRLWEHLTDPMLVAALFLLLIACVVVMLMGVGLVWLAWVDLPERDDEAHTSASHSEMYDLSKP